MLSPQIQLFNDLIESSKFDIKFIDIIRPLFVEKYGVDIYDILYKDLITPVPTSPEGSSDNPIVLPPSRSPSPDFYPQSPNEDIIVDDVPVDDMPIPDEEWHFSDHDNSYWFHDSSEPMAHKKVDSSDRHPIFLGKRYTNDRSFHNGSHHCKYQMCRSYNFLCGNSFTNQPGSVKKCGYQCNLYCELPHECRGVDLVFSSTDSRSHNAPLTRGSKK